MRLLFSGTYHINLLTDWEWIWIVRVEFLSFYIGVPAFVAFVKFAFPDKTPKLTFYITLGVSFIASAIVLLTSVKFFSYTVIPFEIFTVLFGIWMIIIFAKIWREKEVGGLVFLIGFLIIFISLVNDILYLNNLILTQKLFYVGVFIFTIMLAVTLARRLSLAFVKLADINESLVEKNKLIEEKNEELIKLNQELDAFVYRTSHDLRSPITSVRGLLEIAKDEEDPTALQDYFDRGIKVLNRMDTLISDIINFAKNSRMEQVKEKINFPEMIDEIFDNFAFLENANRIEKKCFVELKEDFYSDSKRIGFVLNNLISNAVKYHDFSKQNPFIHIRVSEDGNHVQVEVKDNGQGIAKEHIENIFKMFYRATNSSKGAGLGLYIVKETVAKLKGEIEISSVLNEGTSFKILLPKA